MCIRDRSDITVNGVTEFRKFLFQTFVNERLKVKGSICGIFQKFIQYRLSRFAEGVRDNVSQLDITKGKRTTFVSKFYSIYMQTSDSIVIIPTYNERENIENIENRNG